MYSTALDTLKQMGDVVKGLYDKVCLVSPEKQYLILHRLHRLSEGG